MMTDVEMMRQIAYWLERANDLRNRPGAYERGIGEGYLICAESLQAELDSRKELK